MAVGRLCKPFDLRTIQDTLISTPSETFYFGRCDLLTALGDTVNFCNGVE